MRHHQKHHLFLNYLPYLLTLNYQKTLHYLLNLLNLREASPAEVDRAREGGTPGTVNQFEPVLKVFPDDRPVKVNEYGFDVGATEGFWVVPTN